MYDWVDNFKLTLKVQRFLIVHIFMCPHTHTPSSSWSLRNILVSSLQLPLMFLKIIKFDSNFTNLLDYLLSRALGIYGYRGGQSATLIRIGQSDNPVLIKHIEPFLTPIRLDDHFCPACAFSSSSEDQLIQQLEFYFSQDNITTDFYLRSQMDEEVRDLWFLCEIYVLVELCTYHDNIDICQSQAVY